MLFGDNELVVAVHTYTTDHMLNSKVNLKNYLEDSLEREASCEWAMKSRYKNCDAAFKNLFKEL